MKFNNQQRQFDPTPPNLNLIPVIKGKRRPFLALFSFAFLLWVATPKATAAEQLTIQFGPFEQSIAIADLHKFARSGKVPKSLQPYSPFLTPSVRQLLSQRLLLEPSLGDKVIENVLRSPTGSQIVQSLSLVIPDTTQDQLYSALSQALRRSQGLSIIAVLKAYPQNTLTINASAALAAALQFNASYLQSQALGPILERDLRVPGVWRSHFDPTAPGPKLVRQQTLVLQDWRRTMPDGSFRARTIPVDLYWADIPVHPYGTNPPTPGPLVVISHGFGADRSYLAYLAQHLASHGLTVAAIEHPASNVSWLLDPSVGDRLRHVIPATEFLDRPQDISFLLDELEKFNRQPGPLRGQIDTHRVSVIGHSLGGYTALALAGAQLDLSELRQFCRDRLPIGRSAADWLQCAAAEIPNSKLHSLRDPRVVQVMAFNPLVGRLFGQTGMSQVETPTLVLSGTNDSITPALDHQLRPFARLTVPKYLLTAIGGTHLSLVQAGSFNGFERPSNLPNELQGKPVQPLQQLVQGVSLAFIMQLTPEGDRYKPFLTPQYAQSLSTRQLPLRLNRSLPLSLSEWVEVATLLHRLRWG